MTDDIEKAIAVADKIRNKAEDYLVRMERELAVMGWKPEFRAIMWIAISEAAAKRATAAHQN